MNRRPTPALPLREGAISLFMLSSLKFSLSLTLALSLLLSCSSMPENVKAVDKMPAIYPDYIGVLFINA